MTPIQFLLVSSIFLITLNAFFYYITFSLQGYHY